MSKSMKILLIIGSIVILIIISKIFGLELDRSTQLLDYHVQERSNYGLLTDQGRNLKVIYNDKYFKKEDIKNLAIKLVNDIILKEKYTKATVFFYSQEPIEYKNLRYIAEITDIKNIENTITVEKK